MVFYSTSQASCEMLFLKQISWRFFSQKLGKINKKKPTQNWLSPVHLAEKLLTCQNWLWKTIHLNAVHTAIHDCIFFILIIRCVSTHFYAILVSVTTRFYALNAFKCVTMHLYALNLPSTYVSMRSIPLDSDALPNPHLVIKFEVNRPYDISTFKKKLRIIKMYHKMLRVPKLSEISWIFPNYIEFSVVS